MAAHPAGGEWLVAGYRDDGFARLYRLDGNLLTPQQEIATNTSYWPSFAIDDEWLLIGQMNIGCRIYHLNSASDQWEYESSISERAYGVAISGNVIAVDGTDDELHVYERLDDQWSELAISTPPGGAYIGSSVALDGDWLFVPTDIIGDASAVYVYHRTGDSYMLDSVLAPPEPYFHFGIEVAADDGMLAVGAEVLVDDEVHSAVCVFEHSPEGWNELSSAALEGPWLGSYVALAGGQLAAASVGTCFVSSGISDFDHNGILDRCDVEAGTYIDSDCDNFPDMSPLDRDGPLDCDGDGQPDGCPPFDDCDGNAIPDGCQIAAGLSMDCNENGVPDECEPDCNNNGLPDECDIAGGAADCDSDGLLDVCECSINTCRLVQFTDVTAAAGLAAVIHDRTGVDHYTAGGAVGDFDRDGWQDIYFVAGGAPDQLYLNNGDGTFRNETSAWGLLPGGTQGAAVADYDGDGWLDVFVSGADGQPCRLYHNSRNGAFADLAASAGVALVANTFSAAWGDYDSDGDLDLVATTRRTLEAGQTTLFRNLGNGAFADVTVAAGLAALRTFYGCPGVRLVDFDGDGLQDIFWTWEGPAYSANRGDGSFERITIMQYDFGLGGGSAVADFDEDGDFDVCVTGLAADRPYIERNDGDGRFQYIVDALEDQAMGHLYAAVDAFDADHDTRPDIVVTTKYYGHYVYHNIGEAAGDLALTDVSSCTNFAPDVSGRGLATVDYDNDGDRDVVLFPQTDGRFQWGPATLLPQRPHRPRHQLDPHLPRHLRRL